MDRIIKTFILVAALPLTFAGLAIMFNPEAMLGRLAVVPEGVIGLSTVRSVVGGLLLGSGGMMIWGVLRRESAWFLAVAALMLVVSVGRVAGIALDGVAPEVVKPLVVELALVALLVTGYRRLAPSRRVSAV